LPWPARSRTCGPSPRAAPRFAAWAEPSCWPSNLARARCHVFFSRVADTVTPSVKAPSSFSRREPISFHHCHRSESESKSFPFLSWNRLWAIKTSSCIPPLYPISTRSTEAVPRGLRSNNRWNRPPSRAPHRLRVSSAFVFYLGEFALIYTSSWCSCFTR
jgi:hypothetical protein